MNESFRSVVDEKDDWANTVHFSFGKSRKSIEEIKNKKIKDTGRIAEYT